MLTFKCTWKPDLDFPSVAWIMQRSSMLYIGGFCKVFRKLHPSAHKERGLQTMCFLQGEETYRHHVGRTNTQTHTQAHTSTHAHTETHINKHTDTKTQPLTKSYTT